MSTLCFLELGGDGPNATHPSTTGGRVAAGTTSFEHTFRETQDLIEANEGEFRHMTLSTSVFELAHELLSAYMAGSAKIETQLSSASTHWKVQRMPLVDRNVLRIAIAELAIAESPREVVINEAIEIAKRFGGTKSAPFVNAVLDQISRDIGLL